jgi:hypothetical protein
MWELTRTKYVTYTCSIRVNVNYVGFKSSLCFPCIYSYRNIQLHMLL